MSIFATSERPTTPPHRGGVFVWPHFTWRQDFALCSIIALVCVVTYQLFRPALSGPFIFDDLSNISHLSLINGDFTAERLGAYLYSFSGSLGRPLSALSFLIHDASWPTDPQPFKYTNLLIHLINGLLVFLLSLRLAEDLPKKRSQIIAVVATTMWLLAPLQVASVMLTVQRMALLSAFFTLVGLYLHVRSIRAPVALGEFRAFLLLARLGAFTFLAFLCKENGALLPLFAVCLHATILRPSLSVANIRSRRLITYGAAAPWIVIVFYFITNPQELLAGYESGRDFTLSERVMTEARVLWSYLNSIAVPRIGGHSIFHDDYIVSNSILDPISTLYSVVAWVALAALAIVLRKSYPWFAFSVLWFLVGHAMESTVISLEIYFEHRNYLALLGPLLLFCVGLGKLKVRYAVVLSATWITLASASTYSNAMVWGRGENMANVWFAEHPNSVRARQLKAATLVSAGETRKAISILEQGYAQMPHRGELFFQTLPLRCATGAMSRSLLPEYFAAAQSVHTPQIPAVQLADLRKMATVCGDNFTLTDWWKLTDRLLSNPRMRASNNAIAHIRYQRARAAVQERDLDRTIFELDRSYEVEPNPFIAREQAAHLMSAGLYDDALRYLDISDATKISFWKQWVFDPKALNSTIREAALRASAASAPRALKGLSAPNCAPEPEC